MFGFRLIYYFVYSINTMTPRVIQYSTIQCLVELDKLALNEVTRSGNSLAALVKCSAQTNYAC